jgi:nitrite reductase/ring-hydroxylating ferredoxin subunit
MGGTLVHRNQIGVDIRYAGAGKWKELYIDEEAGPLEVCTIEELEVDQMKLIHIKDKRIVIARTEQGCVAFDDRCTHRGGSLAGGVMICGTAQCPWHGSQFDVKTGVAKACPAKDKID